MKKEVKVILLTILGLTLLYFAVGLFSGRLIQATDFSYPDYIHNFKHGKLFQTIWNSALGQGSNWSTINLSVFQILNLIFPPSALSFNFIPIIGFLLCFIFSYIYFKRLFTSRLTSWFGAIIYTFSPLFVSFIMPGHIAKIYICAFFPLFLYFLDRFLKSETLLDAFLAGLVGGHMMLHINIDVGVLFLTIIPFYSGFVLINKYGVLVILKEQKLIILKLVFIGALIIAISGVFILQISDKISKKNIINAPVIEQAQTKMSNEESWQWATQWSFPPAEVIDLVVGGIYGDFSGSPEAPYWGKTGQSAGWTPGDRTRMMNMSSTSHYLGIILVFFLIYAFLFSRSKHVKFWAIVAFIAMLFSFGRFFPIYKIFTFLPIYKDIRNPNKWLHIVHLAVSIVSVYGIHHFFQALRGSTEPPKQFVKKLWISMGVIFVLFIGLNLYSLGIEEKLIKMIGQGGAIKALSHYHSILFRFLILYFSITIICLTTIKYRKLQIVQKYAIVLLGLILVFDQYSISKKYIEFYDYEQRFQKDQLVDFLIKKNDSFKSRFALLSKGYTLDNLLDWQSQLYNLESSDVRASRSTSAEEITWERLMPRNSFRYFQLRNVTTLLSDYPIQAGVPGYAFPDRFVPQKQIYAYDVPGAQPKAYLASVVTATTNLEQIFGILNSPNFMVGQHAVIIDETTKSYNITNVAQLQILNYENAQIKISANCDSEMYAIFSCAYHPNWKVKVDGKLSKIVRANYIHMGVLVPPGEHTVEFYYDSKTFPFYYYIILYSVLLLMGILLIVKKLKNEK